MKTSLIVPLYIIILLVALPQLSETVYTPVLPKLALDFNISENLAENTLTVYLIGFAVGVLLWGTLSDYTGRKPTILAGLGIYAIACFACYLTESIYWFLVMRFFQAFGASVGSVIGQAIARDSTSDANRGKVFSTVSIALAFAPAIGPVLGNLTTIFFSWKYVFLLLICLSFLISYIIIYKLRETNPNKKTNKVSIYFVNKGVFKQLLCDKEVMGFGILVGGVNGILFGYFSEGPFYFIEILKLSSWAFSLCSFGIIVPLLLGGFLSRYMNAGRVDSIKIIIYGAAVICLAAVVFLLLLHIAGPLLAEFALTILSLIAIYLVIFGIALIIPNALSLALKNYKEIAGAAASIFGFYYYLLASLANSLMSYLHDGTLYRMPLFFFIIGFILVLVAYSLIKFPKKYSELENQG